MRFLLCKDIIYIIHNPWEHNTAVETEQELRQLLPKYKIMRLNTGTKEDEEYANELEKECKEVYPYNLI